ncbi:MAG TPA: murein biosynthesis integral membrane protein MurJ [Mycobacteriales bacterium]|nr:murein biosynthesis integral membrane protein MurJ [Mycobacteriales bacterium]
MYRSGFAEAGEWASAADIRAVPVVEIVEVAQLMPGMDHTGLLDLGGVVPVELRRDDEDTAGVARNSAVMAIGTIASRASGLLRQIILTVVIGSTLFADAYTLANTFPNMVYELLLGGVLTSVIVPLLVKAEKQEPDGGIAFIQRLLTMTLAVFTVITAVAVVAAPLITLLFVGDPGERPLTTAFAYLLLLEIVFYALAAVFGAVLNSRGRFAAPMWAPVLNNAVVIATGGVFLAMHGFGTPTADSVTLPQIIVLGLGTTLGIAAQAVSLWIPLRRLGFRWKWRFDWRGTGLAEARGLAGWLLLYVLLSQLGVVAIMRVAKAAGEAGGPSVAIYNNAYLLFMLPHGIVAVSVITALLPRMSRAAVDGRFRALADDLALGTRLSATVLLPAAAIMVFLGSSAGLVLFGYGNTSAAQAKTTGAVFAVACLGLLPFAVSQMQTFAFYAMRDAKTPTLVNAAAVTVRVVGAGAVAALAPVDHVLHWLMAVNSLSYLVAMVVGGMLLRRRLGTVRGRNTASTIARIAAASVPALLVTWAADAGIRAVAGTGHVGGILALLAGLLAGGVAYVCAALLLRVREVHHVLGMVQRRLGRA